MFTGIIEEVGQLTKLSKQSITISCSKLQEDLHIGDSIAVNGICLTVTNFSKKDFSADISEETLRVTNIGELKVSDYVNLERAMQLNGRFGGHIVNGHIDCVGKILSIEKLDDFYNFEIELPNTKYQRYFVEKGSVSINGISLTIFNLTDTTFKIAVIPHTFESTNLKTIKKGSNVNIEFDIMAKYIEKNLLANDNKSNITTNFLIENGFI